MITRRQLVALVALLTLLFAQVSSAAYACAPLSHPHGMAASAMSGDCPGHTPAAADTLCALHCDTGASIPAAHAPDVAPAPSAVLVVESPFPGIPRSSFVPASSYDAMATAPPVAIRFCRLLI
ncbi:MAG: hypothetical protein U1F54_17635 [Burkholderiales bacterium]